MIEAPKGTSWFDVPDIVKGIGTALAGALIAMLLAFARWLRGAFWRSLLAELSKNYASKSDYNALRRRVAALERRLGPDENGHYHREGDHL